MSFVKKSMKRFKIREMKDGVEGTYLGTDKVEVTDTINGTGEMKEIKRHKFDIKGDKWVCNGDAGLNSALADAEVKPGDMIQVKHTGKSEIAGGQRNVNTYDVLVDDGKTTK